MNDLFADSAARTVLRRAFGDLYPAFVRALIDPRMAAWQKRPSCRLRREGIYRIAICGTFGDPYGTGYVIMNDDASQYIAGFVQNSVYTIRASEDWTREQPAFVKGILRQFSGKLPAGIVGTING